MAQTVFSVFIIFYILEFLFETFLTLMNAKFAVADKHTIPDAVRVHLDEEKYKKTNAYTLAKSKFATLNSAISMVIMLAIIFGGAFDRFDIYLRSYIVADIHRGVIYILAATYMMTILGLPASIYHTFVLEAKFDFNKTTPIIFIIDFFKGIILSSVLMTPLLYGLFAFVEHAGSLWWLFAAVAIIAFQLALAFIYPVAIAPLFNKFTPLEDTDLNNKIKALADSIAFPLKEIKVMDGSKRSKHSNAYFTGFGNTKRIVLFDTLIEKMNHDEILAVLAHEMGHWKHKHILKQMIVSAGFTVFAFFMLSTVLKGTWLFEAFDVRNGSHYLGFILFGLIFSTLTFWLSPLFSIKSRRNEFEADAFAVAHGPKNDALSNALIKLNAENLGNLFPHPFYVFFHYSHPPLLERLRAIQ